MNFKFLALSLTTVSITSFLYADPFPSAFTYQGRLLENGLPVNGLYFVNCRLHPYEQSESSYVEVATWTGVTNGIFTLTLDFENALLNGYRWLEISLMEFSTGTNFTTLQPRQYLTSAPYAFRATRADQADRASTVTYLSVGSTDIRNGAVTATKIDEGQVVKSLNGLHDDIIIDGAEHVSVITSGRTISIAAAVGDNTNAVELGHLNSTTGHNSTVSGGELNRATADACNIGGGWGNFIDTNGAYATIGGGGFNTATTSGSVISGGTGNRAYGFSSVIGGGSGNLVEDLGVDNAIGGGYGNRIEIWADACTIAAGWLNVIGTNAWASTVGGGDHNRIGSSINWGNHHATIGGGAYNEIMEADNANVTISGGYSNRVESSSASSTIGGGEGNTIRDSSHYSTIAGGIGNATRFPASAVGGGKSNKATGYFSVVPGGRNNEADGYLSFAAGENAHAMHLGSFVWADASGTNVSSSTANEFTVRASGGVRFFSSPNSSSGAILERGSGSWSSLCDRNAKTNIAAVSPQQILEAVASLPIATWNYKTQNESTRHIGPMAQDFHEAFQLGENERHISTVDATGVSLAAIQGLHELVRKQETEIQELKKALAEMKAALTSR